MRRFFHPDCNRRLRDRTGIGPLRLAGSGQTPHYRRWGIAPRPEDSIDFLLLYAHGAALSTILRRIFSAGLQLLLHSFPLRVECLLPLVQGGEPLRQFQHLFIVGRSLRLLQLGVQGGGFRINRIDLPLTAGDAACALPPLAPPLLAQLILILPGLSAAARWTAGCCSSAFT